MDKQNFLSLLRTHLVKLEVNDENIEKYIKQFERYFNTMNEEEINDQIENFDGVEGIALNIKKLIKKKQDTLQNIWLETNAEKNEMYTTNQQIQLKVEQCQNNDSIKTNTSKFDDSTQDHNADDTRIHENANTDELYNKEIEKDKEKSDIINVNKNDEIPEDYDFLKKKNRFIPATITENLQNTDNSNKIKTTEIPSQRNHINFHSKKTPNKTVTGQTEIENTTHSTQINKTKKNQTETEHKPIIHNNEFASENMPVRISGKITTSNIDLNEIDESFYEDTAIPNTALFWIVVLLTIPITVPLFLTVLLLFFCAFSFLAVSIVALLAGLIFIIIVGTGFSLVGIIYGITIVFKSLPVGLFEIGLGVIIGGSAMLIGILVYNVAIRFLPFVIKYLIVFFMFTMHKIKDLLKFIKRECAKQ